MGPASRAEAPLALVHSDSCGPFCTAMIAGAKYFVLLVHDYSQMTWVHFLRTEGHQEVLGASSFSGPTSRSTPAGLYYAYDVIMDEGSTVTNSF